MHIGYRPGTLRILDQTQLPQRTEFLELTQWQLVADAIRGMKVRGAPAIGIVAAYGMAVAAHAAHTRGLSGDEFFHALEQAAAELHATRPTAVNLQWAIRQVRDAIAALRENNASTAAVAAALDALASRIHEDDIAACRRIGDAGASLLAADSQVLTHCNTGDLATGGYGTALGVVRSAWREGRLVHVYVSETRPLLQGSRLTTWELQRDNIPFTLITDSMAAHFMRRGEVTAVIVGADRIARNGDVANKIGTYGLAVLARAHGIPFIVAAPLSTLDEGSANGGSIPIEERAAAEVTQMAGVPIAPARTAAANPAFDITPAEYVSAIVTEEGIVQPPFARTVAALLTQHPPIATAASR